MSVYVGPPQTPHVGTLRSIAASIEPAFPDAADTLRVIANALLAAHPAPVPDQQAVAAITEWFMREHFGRDLGAMDADEAWAKPLANYRDHYSEKARAILAALATGQGPDTGGEGE